MQSCLWIETQFNHVRRLENHQSSPVTFGPSKSRLYMFEKGTRPDFVMRLNDESPIVVDSNTFCSPGNNTSSNTSNNKMKVNMVVPSKQRTTKSITCTDNNNNNNNNNFCLKIHMSIIVCIFIFFQCHNFSHIYIFLMPMTGSSSSVKDFS